MSRILRIDQPDYRVKVSNGGTITFDTGPTAGTVVITGNLDVRGTTTTVQSTVTTINDNIVVINAGETGNGISGTLNYQAGIQIERGAQQDAYLLFKENITHWNSNTNSVGTGSFVLKTISDLGVEGQTGLQLNSISAPQNTNLNFDMQAGTGVLKIANATNYHERVINDSDIPNRRFVTTYVADYIASASLEKISKVELGVEKSRAQATTTSLDFVINSNLIATVTSGGLTVNSQINILNNTITNISPTQKLILTATNALVEVDASLNIVNRASAPAFESGRNKVYSLATIGPGSSGLYFTNTTVSDELVAKNRALLFSMLF